MTPELGENGLLEIRITATGSVGRLPIALQREVALYPRTPGHDALRYLVKEPNYALDLRNPKHGILS